MPAMRIGYEKRTAGAEKEKQTASDSPLWDELNNEINHHLTPCASARTPLTAD
jgi:hypothetical protein